MAVPTATYQLRDRSSGFFARARSRPATRGRYSDREIRFKNVFITYTNDDIEELRSEITNALNISILSVSAIHVVTKIYVLVCDDYSQIKFLGLNNSKIGYFEYSIKDGKIEILSGRIFPAERRHDDRKPDGPTDHRELREHLTDDEKRAQIHSKVDKLSGSSLTELWAFLNALATKPEPSPQSDAKALIPTEPPDGQLYENRSDKKQSAPDFISSVYKDFLNGTFTRADLRHIDSKAAMALYNWERINGRSSINLPTKREKTDAIIANVGGGSDDLLRALQAVSKRKPKR